VRWFVLVLGCGLYSCFALRLCGKTGAPREVLPVWDAPTPANGFVPVPASSYGPRRGYH
jgi:hypothetical protein